jgi:hypothetical protein
MAIDHAMVRGACLTENLPRTVKFRHMEDQLIINDSGVLITVDIATASD